MPWTPPWITPKHCRHCSGGWICAIHREHRWPHAGCDAFGIPCPALLEEIREATIRARLRHRDPRRVCRWPSLKNHRPHYVYEPELIESLSATA